jgi:hypothetical protein
MSSSSSTTTSNRFILLCDLDCFFVQVARRRDETLIDKPFCIEQHGDIICVSYEARRLGMKKHMSIDDALSIDNSVRFVSIDTSYGSKISYAGYFEERYGMIRFFLAPSIEIMRCVAKKYLIH